MVLRNLTIVLLVAILSLSSCVEKEYSNSKVLQEKISLHNLTDIIQKVKSDNQITKEEIEYFTNGMLRLSSNKDSVVGKSVAEIIKKQREYVHNQSLTFFERTISRVNLGINHKFNYIGLQVRDADNQMTDVIVYEITNTSDKEIKNVKGLLQFYSQENLLIKQYNLNFELNLQPNETKRSGNPFVHDKDNPRDNTIRNSTNLKAIWNPEEIEFTDGTRKAASDIK